MSDQKEPPPPIRRIITEPRAKYTIIDGNRVFNFEFPSQSTPMQHYDIISYLRDELWVAIENQKKKEDENSAKEGEKEKN